MDIYIKPSGDWHEFREQNLSTLNFTWNVREFNDKVMRIKLNFNNASYISPYLKYDSLVVSVKNMNSLFVPKHNAARRLQEEQTESEVSHGIQKQMKDND